MAGPGARSVASMGREGHPGRRGGEGGPAATTPSPRASTAAPRSALWAGSLKACSAASPPRKAGSSSRRKGAHTLLRPPGLGTGLSELREPSLHE